MECVCVCVCGDVCRWMSVHMCVRVQVEEEWVVPGGEAIEASHARMRAALLIKFQVHLQHCLQLQHEGGREMEGGRGRCRGREGIEGTDEE